MIRFSSDFREIRYSLPNFVKILQTVYSLTLFKSEEMDGRCLYVRDVHLNSWTAPKIYNWHAPSHYRTVSAGNFSPSFCYGPHTSVYLCGWSREKHRMWRLLPLVRPSLCDFDPVFANDPFAGSSWNSAKLSSKREFSRKSFPRLSYFTEGLKFLPTLEKVKQSHYRPG